MSEFASNTTSQLPGDTSPDNYRVLLRGYETILTTDWTLSSGLYYATKSIDLGQYQFAIAPMVEAYINDAGTIWKMPAYAQSSGSLFVQYNIQLSTGSKFSNQSTKINFVCVNTFGSQATIWWQLMSLPALGVQFV